MIGLGIGIGVDPPQGPAAAAPSTPVIQNGTFADSSNWTIASGGGAASLSITPGSPGTLNSVSGSGNAAATCTQTLSGLVNAQSYVISFTTTARTNGSITLSLGGGSTVVAGGAVGADSATLVCGAANQDLVIRPTSSLAGRTISITNLTIA